MTSTRTGRTTGHGSPAGLPSPHTAADDAATPCVARPHAGLVHRDGACRCFTGGPAPEHARPEDRLLGLAFHGAV